VGRISYKTLQGIIIVFPTRFSNEVRYLLMPAGALRDITRIQRLGIRESLHEKGEFRSHRKRKESKVTRGWEDEWEDSESNGEEGLQGHKRVRGFGGHQIYWEDSGSNIKKGIRDQNKGQQGVRGFESYNCKK
jgi:hypothetical protein